MGRKFSPIYATLVLVYLVQLENEFDTEFRQYKEDNFVLFIRSNDDLEKLYRKLNALHPSIKYTIDKSKSNLPFLDRVVINKSGKIQIPTHL